MGKDKKNNKEAEKERNRKEGVIQVAYLRRLFILPSVLQKERIDLSYGDHYYDVIFINYSKMFFFY